MKKDKYLWYTDLHLNRISPITKFKFISHIRKEDPKAIFLTGDISNGIMTPLDLQIMATWIKCPIYFVLGNHDYFTSSFEEMNNKIKNLCKRYPNLIWLTNSDIISLTQEVALIGTEGWYDANNGNPNYLKLTPDWILIKELRELSSMNDRIDYFKKIANQSCILIEEKLEAAFAKDYKTVYIATHFPPWKEATRNVGTWFEKFWLPYNVNLRLGKTIENIMKNKTNKHVIVLSGHVHSDVWINVSSNIECKVNKNKNYSSLRNEEHIFI